jgi:hypothetical protein
VSELEPIFSLYYDNYYNICLSVISDRGIGLLLSMLIVAGQVDERSLKGLIRQGSRLKTVEI